nr:MAG TPA: minor tail protein [Caudoviricetes sp.]
MATPMIQEVKVVSSGVDTLVYQLSNVEKRLRGINETANNSLGMRKILSELQSQHHTLKAMASDLKTSADKLMSIDQRASTVLQNATRQAQAFSAAASTMNVRLNETGANLTKLQSTSVRWTSDMGRATSGLTRVADTTQKAAAAAQRSAAEHAKVANHTRNVNQHLQSTLSLSNNLHGVWRGMSASAGMIWLSWGNTLGMIAGLVPSIAALKSIGANRELGWQMALVGAAAEEGDARVKELTHTLLDMGGGQYTQGPLQMAEALRVLAQAGLKTQEAMSLLPSVLNMALVAGTSDEQAALFTTGLRSAFNLYDSASLKAGMDQTAMAANVSQTSIEQMMMSMKQASAAANKFGLSVADTSTTLALLARVNITGSSAGTAVRNLLTDLAGRTEKSRKALEALGISAYDASGMVKPFTQIIAELQEKFRGMDDKSKQLWMRSFLDERGMRAADVLLNTTTEEFRKLHQEILRGAENMGYTNVQAARLGDTAEGSFRKMKAAWESTFAVVGGQTEGPYKGILDSLTNLANRPDVVNGLTGIANGLISVAKAGVTVVSTLTTLMPLITSVGASFATLAAVKGVTTLTAQASALTTAVSALKGVTAPLMALLPTGPLGIALAALAASAAGIYTYISMTSNKANEFALAMKNIRSDIAAVSTETYKAFNQTGAGHRIDVKLGIDSETGKHFDTEYQALLTGVQNKTALLYQQTSDAFAKNLARINQVTQEELTTLAAQTDKILAAQGERRIEQELMIRDRKQTLLMDQLTNLDKMLASQGKLSEQDRDLRVRLEHEVYDNAIRLMNLRTAYAVQKLQEIRAEAVATASVFDRFMNPDLRMNKSTERLAGEAEEAVRSGTATQRQREFMAYRATFAMQNPNLSKEQVDKMAAVQFYEGALTQRQIRDFPSHVKTVEAAAGKPFAQIAAADPDKWRNALAATLDSAEKERNAIMDELASARRRNHTTDIQLAQNRLQEWSNTWEKDGTYTALLNAQYAIRRADSRQAYEKGARPQVEVTGNNLGTPPSSRSAGHKRVPTYSGVSADRLVEQDLKRQLANVEFQIAEVVRQQGFISADSPLLKQQMDLAQRLNRTVLSSSIEGLRVQIREAESITQSAEASAADKEEARKRLSLLQAEMTRKLTEQTTVTVRAALPTTNRGLRIKAGAEAGGQALPGTYAAAQLAQQTFGDRLVRFGAFRDRYHIGRASKHNEGLAFDFTPRADLSRAQKEAMAEQMRQALRSIGLQDSEFTVKFEWAGKRNGNGTRSTADHIHTQLNSVAAAQKMQQLAQNPQTRLAASGDVSGEANYVNKALDSQRKYAEEAIKYQSTLAAEQLGYDQKRLEMEIQLGVYSEERSRELQTQFEIRKLEVEKARELKILEARGVTDDPNNDQDLYSVTARRYDEKISLVKEQMENQIRLQRDWRMGLQRSYNEIVANSFNYAKFASSQMDSVVGHMTSSMENLAITGRFRFREMTVSILQDLSKIYMRMATMKLVNYVGSYLFGGSGVSTAGGSIGGMFATAAHGRVFNSSGLVAFARGGVVSSPTYFGFNGGRGLMGEQGSEAVMPLTRTANGNLGVQVQGMGGGTVVNAPVSVSVTVNSDGSTESGVNANEAKQLGEAIRNTVVEQVTRMLRPGEIINSAIRNGGVA